MYNFYDGGGGGLTVGEEEVVVGRMRFGRREESLLRDLLSRYPTSWWQ